MPFTTAPAWAIGDIVTEAKMDIISADLEYLNDSYKAWTSYTPTLTQSATVTKTVTYAKYAQFGMTVHVNVYLAVTGAGTAGNAIQIGLPVTAANGGVIRAIGSGLVFDTSTTTYYGGIAVPSTTTVVGLVPTSTAGSNYLGVADFTAGLASGDQVSFHAIYEAA